MRGIKAHVVMPKNTPRCKIDNVKRHGGQIYFCENNVEAREKLAAEVESETGAVFVAPFNDSRVMRSVLRKPLKCYCLVRVGSTNRIGLPTGSGSCNLAL